MDGAYLDDNPKTQFGQAKPGIADIPPIALLVQGMAHRDGRQKYGRMNWRERTVTASIYYEAAGRHMGAWWDGEEIASDSGVHHLGHAIACLNIMLDMIFMEKADPEFSWNDDRPPKGSMPFNMAELIWPIDPETGKPTRPESNETVIECEPEMTWDAIVQSFYDDMALAGTPEERQEVFKRHFGFDLDEGLVVGCLDPEEPEEEEDASPSLDWIVPDVKSENFTIEIDTFLKQNGPLSAKFWKRIAKHLGYPSSYDTQVWWVWNQRARTKALFYVRCYQNGIHWSFEEMDNWLGEATGAGAP